jgi:hypothetical protein
MVFAYKGFVLPVSITSVRRGGSCISDIKHNYAAYIDVDACFSFLIVCMLA